MTLSEKYVYEFYFVAQRVEDAFLRLCAVSGGCPWQAPHMSVARLRVFKALRKRSIETCRMSGSLRLSDLDPTPRCPRFMCPFPHRLTQTHCPPRPRHSKWHSGPKEVISPHCVPQTRYNNAFLFMHGSIPRITECERNRITV